MNDNNIRLLLAFGFLVYWVVMFLVGSKLEDHFYPEHKYPVSGYDPIFERPAGVYAIWISVVFLSLTIPPLVGAYVNEILG